MSVENSVILVTNESNIVDILKPKLVLLREVDNIMAVDYSKALSKVKEIKPQSVIVYCPDDNQKDDCLSIIREMRQDKITKFISIILLLNEYDQDFLLSAYDEGITDYLIRGFDDAEILMRTIWSFKKNSQLKTINKQNELLKKLEVVDENTEFFTNKYSEKIFENEFERLAESNSDAILMMISVAEESKVNVSASQFATAIKKSIRHSDIVVNSLPQRFFILLSDTQLKGAFIVWDKIKKSLGSQYKLLCSVKAIEGQPFADLETSLLNGLVEAESSGQELVIVSDEEKKIMSEGWLDKINSAQKNFKLFKQAFNKKLENVINPVFYQVQQTYEAKLFETQVEQYSNSTLSEFTLKSAKRTSSLKITYPGFSKINIDIIHQGLDSPENSRISMDLTELSESRLIKVLENFIKEYKSS